MGGFDGWTLDEIPTLDPRKYNEMFRRDDLPTETKDAPSTPPSPSPSPNITSTGELDRSEYRILVTKSELKDKSKGNALVDIFAVLQTTWFISQYLERWHAHQPRTQLEVMTLAYAVLNILIRGLWYKKPLNVQKPIDVHGRASGAIKLRKADIWSDIITFYPRGTLHLREGTFIPRRWTSRPVTIFEFVTAGVIAYVGLLFGGVHCLAWRFSFPTITEQVLWRASAVFCTASPVVAAGLLSVLEKVQPKPVFLIVIAVMSVGVYVICRAILVALTFTSLRASPAGVFQATAWTSLFPHFG